MDNKTTQKDWGQASGIWDELKKNISTGNLEKASEAQTRFDFIDRIIREVLGWSYGQINVEERCDNENDKYADYILRSGDITIVIEAKKSGASFPSPTKKNELKLDGTILGTGEIAKAITQAVEYAKNKAAQATVVTNGKCWCLFVTSDYLTKSKAAYAKLLFPLEEDTGMEKLFNFLSNTNITNKGLTFLKKEAEIISDNKLLTIVSDSETRIDRNNVADYLAPALDSALYSDAFLKNPEYLKKCYVMTKARVKFDKTLEMHLVDSKPISVQPAKRIKIGKQHGFIEKIVEVGRVSFAPPVTLVLAPVGVGKSTYLKHFELVYGKEIIEKKKAHWIYIDFEAMGREKNVRMFVYEKLKDYLQDINKSITTDYEKAIKPAYENEIEALRRGPLALLSRNKDEFDKKISEHIWSDFEKGEPFVDKVLGYISKNELCIVVLDNIDLYEDDELEKTVLSEGLALSKRIFCNVIVAIRDTTFVKHKDDSIFNAFELRKLWLDPPPFKEVLSKRLSLSKKILEGVNAKIPFSNGMVLDVPDLSVFFEIVQRSILYGAAGDFVESLAGLNIRKGITYVKNFLTSGHIHADKALKMYLKTSEYDFPFHEVFKGSILGMWKYYKEIRLDCLNIFDSKMNAKSLRLIRLYILTFLHLNAKSEKTAEVSVRQCVDTFSSLGANTEQIINVISDLKKFDLIRTLDAKAVSISSVVHITKTGGYYSKVLACKLPYIEACLYDTIIDDTQVWNELKDLTLAIEAERDINKRFSLRKKRLDVFMKYLLVLEKDSRKIMNSSEVFINSIERIYKALHVEFENALSSLEKYYPTKK